MTSISGHLDLVLGQKPVLVQDVPRELKRMVMNHAAGDPGFRTAIGKITLRLQNPRRSHQIALVELSKGTIAVRCQITPRVGNDLGRDPLGFHEVVPVLPGFERDPQSAEQ